MDVVAESRAALQRQRRGEHSQDCVHGPSLLQGLVQRLGIDAAGYEVGQQQEEVKTLEAWRGAGCDTRRRFTQHESCRTYRIET